MRWLGGAVLALACAATPSWAQGSAEQPSRFRVGPLGLTPVIRLTNAGWDSNILNRAVTDSPTDDVTATVSPSVDTSIRLTRVRVTARGQLDFYYFRESEDYRAVDVDSSARAEVPLNRLTPYVFGRLLKTQHRQNLEIDAIATRRDEGVRVGADFQLTAKTTVGVYGERSKFAYEANSLFGETDLARSLNHEGNARGLSVRYAATPLTTVGINVQQQRDEFASSPQRNADSLRVEPSVEFKPLALVSGRAAIGFRRLKFRQGDLEGFKGTVASVDLQYTFRARTLVAVGARRDLEYSYLFPDYLLSGFTVSLTHRLGDSWEVGGSASRYRIDYRDEQNQLFEAFAETNLNRGASIGYRLSRATRLGFGVNYLTRSSDLSAGRIYERLRVSSSVTYEF